MRTLLASLFLLLPLGCRSGEKVDSSEATTDTGALAADRDGDGFPASEDCDDDDASVNGGATEVCDGIDNNCDGQIDEGVLTQGFADEDGDTFGDPDAPVESCDLDGAVTNANDCDDQDAAVYPGAIEACNGVDDDCDTLVDEDLLIVYYLDADGDGQGDPDEAVESCEPPEGFVTNADDCDDTDSGVFSGAVETCNDVDDDCDGDVDEGVTTTYYLDADGDGYGGDSATVEACEPPLGYSAVSTDCDDTDVAYNPGAAESDCTDPNDYNCDGSVAYADSDGDGFAACEECNDADPAINPAATEVCDSVDNDCDGDVDDDDSDVDLSTGSDWYADVDGDTFGDATTSVTACAQPTGFVADDQDCDDGAVAVNPAATEVCNSVDDDCDGLIDDADSSLDTATATTWYDDADSDGYGDAANTQLACTQPAGTSATDTDCDDADAAINPAAAEVCDGVDNDCDSDVDDADADVAGQSTWYTDADSDGYGGASSVEACSQPSGTVSNSGDCDDGVAAVNPGAAEVCNSVDDDCDGLTDDSDPSVTGTSTWYVDSDSDGYGSTTAVQACSQPAGTSSTSDDCNDGAANISPGATEQCNTVDDDCDGSTDEGFDADGDGILDCDEITYTVTWVGTGDDTWTAYVDGSSQGSFGGWNTANSISVTLDSGDHVLAAYAADTGLAIAGYAAVVYVDGAVESVTGDGSWLYTRSPGSSWTAVSYNSSGWSTSQRCSSSQVSTYWGSNPASIRNAGARWIWWTTDCTQLGSAYFRYEFTLP